MTQKEGEKMARYPMKRQAGQSVDEMAEQMMESSAKNRANRLYPEASAEVKREALANVVNQQRQLMKAAKERGRRIDLNDLDEVEKCADDYMQSCVKANCFPTMLGFSASAGYSRKYIYQYIRTHTNESSRYLDNLRSSWAAIMAQMALSRQASEATVIFLLKNCGQDLTDKCELTAVPAVEEKEISREELERWFLDENKDQDENTNAWGRVYD